MKARVEKLNEIRETKSVDTFLITSAGLEHLVLVTKGGYDILTKFNHCFEQN